VVGAWFDCFENKCGGRVTGGQLEAPVKQWFPAVDIRKSTSETPPPPLIENKYISAALLAFVFLYLFLAYLYPSTSRLSEKP